MARTLNETNVNLTAEEKRLLEAFRKLTPEQRRKVIALARKLVENGEE